MKKFIYIYLILVISASAVFAQSTRVSGLEDNEEYLDLIGKETQLQIKEDSLNNTITRIRREFRENRENRDYYASEILRLEGEIFDVRNETGIIAGKISAIEQEYLLNNLTVTYIDTNDTAGHLLAADTDRQLIQLADLTANAVFRKYLTVEDYKELQSAQKKEREAMTLFSEFMAGYETIISLIKENSSTESPLVADSLYNAYIDIEQSNSDIAASLYETWDYIYDNKRYSYNYLLERLGDREMLSILAEQSFDIRDKIAGKRDAAESPEVYTYIVAKSELLKFEKALADRLGLPPAVDSLTKAEQDFTLSRKDIPRLYFEEKLFLDLSEIMVDKSKYNNQSRIPETVIHPKGRIYRILLGSYTRVQSPGIFKGVYPISYVKDSRGRYNYYAGGYATVTGAVSAVAQLRSLGFKSPQVALWDNGRYSLLSEDQINQQNVAELYQVVVSVDSGSLPQDIKDIIEAMAPGKDIGKKGNEYIVGPFTSQAEAADIVEAARKAGSGIAVRIDTIPNQ